MTSLPVLVTLPEPHPLLGRCDALTCDLRSVLLRALFFAGAFVLGFLLIYFGTGQWSEPNRPAALILGVIVAAWAAVHGYRKLIILRHPTWLLCGESGFAMAPAMMPISWGDVDHVGMFDVDKPHLVVVWAKGAVAWGRWTPIGRMLEDLDDIPKTGAPSWLGRAPWLPSEGPRAPRASDWSDMSDRIEFELSDEVGPADGVIQLLSVALDAYRARSA